MGGGRGATNRGGVQSVSSERADTNGAANICVLKDPGILRLIYLRSCSSRKSFSPFCNQRKCDKETEDSCITLKLIIFLKITNQIYIPSFQQLIVQALSLTARTSPYVPFAISSFTFLTISC